MSALALAWPAIATPALAHSDSAKRVLKGMPDYMAAQQKQYDSYGRVVRAC